ncbi:hypothetical protein [Streptomyces carpinensis]|uniref:Transposase n=1 Tax=Streptomyces carpinensis TaxID=66369 RepID=A0ABV1VYX1_9ACTN|nr:hypothetical protein [Streptomyces carpinensis]
MYDHGEWTSSKGKPEAWLTEKEQAKLLRLEQRAAHRKSFRKRAERTSNRCGRPMTRSKGFVRESSAGTRNWQQQTTTEIAVKYSVLVVEDLAITNMTKSARGGNRPGPREERRAEAGLNRAISQEAWGRTVTMLTYKAA